MAINEVLRLIVCTIVCTIAGYITFLAVLAIPYFQNHVIYLHRVKLTWRRDINVPEQWGFLRNQVTSFAVQTNDGETLSAWHILPLELYREHESTLVAEPAGFVTDTTKRHAFHLLRSDPNAVLVLYFHGAGGTLGSGYRPDSYRAIYAGAPKHVHIVAIDYRGFGDSTGSSPSEAGLLTDASTLARWATDTAGIPPERIVLIGQSLGTAVAIALAHHKALQSTPRFFAGMVLVAPFADVETLTKTYRVAKTVPLLSPLAYFPRLMKLFNCFIVSKWCSKDRILQFVRVCENMEEGNGRYDITFIHAQDDHDIPWEHSAMLYSHAVSASRDSGVSFDDVEGEKQRHKRSLGAGAWTVEHRTKHGVVKEQILRYGLHDKIMGYPVVSLAIRGLFENHVNRSK